MDSPNHLEQRPPSVYELALAEEEARRRRAIARLDEQAIAARVGGNRYLMAWYQGLHGGRQTIQPFDGGQGLLLDRLIGNVQISPLLPSPPHTSTYLPNLIDLDIYRGDDIDLRLVVTNQDGTPADLTVDTNVRAQIRSAPDDPDVLGSFIPAIDVTAPDIIRLKLPRTVSADLPPLCVWDCEVQQGKAAIPPVSVAHPPATSAGGGSINITIPMAIPAGEWLLLVTPIIPQTTLIYDSAGNEWHTFYAPGFNPVDQPNRMNFWQCQVASPIQPGTTILPGSTLGGGVTGRIIWVPGSAGGISGFSGNYGTLPGQTPTQVSTTEPIGAPGQMIVAISMSQNAGGVPQWTPESLTTQLGPVQQNNTISTANGALLAGVNLPSVEKSSPSATWPAIPITLWSLAALAYDVALPWTTTIVAGTITTTPDVTRY